MASYTITTTANQDAGITRALARENADRALRSLAPITAVQYVDTVLKAAWDSWKVQADAEDQESIRVAYVAATPAQRTAARAAIGLP